jgi:protein-L-isoaspartate(D-aspartate) O-methyltransferase
VFGTLGIEKPALERALLQIPREAFVPARLQERAYEDTALPIGQEQTISQPSMVVLMLAALACRSEHRVLEVGGGSGYAAALLSKLASEVHAIELREELAKNAQAAISRLGIDNVQFHVGDGARGLPELAPFDRILVSAASASVPEALLEQLAQGGILVMPVGSALQQTLSIAEKDASGQIRYRTGVPCVFVPLVSPNG